MTRQSFLRTIKECTATSPLSHHRISRKSPVGEADDRKENEINSLNPPWEKGPEYWQHWFGILPILVAAFWAVSILVKKGLAVLPKGS